MECEMAKKAKWRRHTLEFKRQVVERMKTCQNIHELARELKIERKLLYIGSISLKGGPNRSMRIWESPQKTAKRNSIAKRSPS